MLNLSFDIQTDEDGKVWTVNHTPDGEFKHWFADLKQLAQTYYAAGRASVEEDQKADWTPGLRATPPGLI